MKLHPECPGGLSDAVQEFAQFRPLRHKAWAQPRRPTLHHPPVCLVQGKGGHTLKRNEIPFLPAPQCVIVHFRRPELVLQRDDERSKLIR